MYGSQADLDSMDQVIALSRYDDDPRPAYYGVDAVDPDEESAAALRETFGPLLTCLEQRWLIWLSVGSGSKAPVGFAQSPRDVLGEGWLLAGAADLVVGQRYNRIQVQVLSWRATIGAIATATGNTPVYVTIVADRYDDAGRRVDRLLGDRCRIEDAEARGDWYSVEIEVDGEWRWWSALEPDGGPLRG